MVWKLLLSCWRLVSVPFRYQLARLRFRRGDLRAARLASQRLIRDVPRHFGAHVLLGRIHLRQKDFNRAKHEFLTAREIDPTRFLRLTNALDGPSESGGIRINLFYFSNGSGGADEVPADASQFLGALFGDEDWCEGSGDGLRFGDFMNYREYRKFRAMPAITEDEIAQTDWDEVLSEFYEPDES